MMREISRQSIIGDELLKTGREFLYFQRQMTTKVSTDDNRGDLHALYPFKNTTAAS